MELILVLAVLAAIAAIALPTYNDSVLKVRRAEAKSALYSVMQQQERFYTQKNSYASFSNSTENPVFKEWSGESEKASHYQLSAHACSEKTLQECVLITAMPIDFIDPICGNLMLNSANQKTYSNSTIPNSLCW